jgi:outer membrane protein OmpA-like peptidoglycan-associated protein
MAKINHSKWEHIDSATRCELMHPIPEYGTARFVQSAGDELKFLINTYHPPHDEGSAVLRETSPPWIHQPSEDRLLHVDVSPEDPPFILKHRESMWLLHSLERGRVGCFEYRDWEESKYQIRVSLNPINFHSAFRYFQKCRKGLLDYGFDQIRNSEVNFDTDKFELNEISIRNLKHVTRYALSDPSIYRIIIRGHTDSVASNRYNMGLSAKRAQSVRNYFIAEGVDSKRLSISFYGETRPKKENSTEQGRAINRRVEIELYR